MGRKIPKTILPISFEFYTISGWGLLQNKPSPLFKNSIATTSPFRFSEPVLLQTCSGPIPSPLAVELAALGKKQNEVIAIKFFSRGLLLRKNQTEQIIELLVSATERLL